MKFFIDTANLAQIKEANDLGILDGVTTNPSLMAKEGIKDGFVVTPSRIPRSFASLICARLAVSIKNFISISYLIFKIE